ncbi:MAG: redoxin domain-containing protein [Prolixibacteraceae bacterium]|jgi:peroxiredoxin|nr:redoxin domain-containing protein [Prolixibacteraceae bacterium]
MKNLTINLISTIILISFFLSGCNNTKKQEETGFEPNPVTLEKQKVETLKIGEKAPDFTLPGVSGEMVSLSDFEQAEVLVVAFTCNHCPTAQAYEDRLIEFTKDYKDKGVAVIAISPNSPLALLPQECSYSDMGDTYAEMKVRAKEKGYNFPYLYDGDNHEVSIKYGPVTTPHLFVFDKNRALKYKGRFDGNEKPGTGNAEDLRKAVDQTLAGKEVTNPVTKTFGCSVKWSWKNEWTKQVNKEWKEKPVSLETIDEQKLGEIMENNSENLRLINIWATWCTPCVLELPDIIQLQRIYGNRDFELVTVSSDKIKNKDKSLELLKKHHASNKNYIFNNDDKYKLIEGVDPEWQGSIPYTILIEPGGEIVYRHQGTVDLYELKKAIVEHPMVGRYY